MSALTAAPASAGGQDTTLTCSPKRAKFTIRPDGSVVFNGFKFV